MKQYSPKSHFFTDLSGLTSANVNESFGPVDGDLTTKYRVTSFVNGTANLKIKLFAISGGSLMIFPQKDNVGNLTGKLNIVIKPSQMNWSPLKIKYFVYRGVEKDDFFDSNWILKEPVADSPQILTKMWAYFKSLNLLPSITGVIFPVEYIFQLNTPSDKLLDEHFTNSLINCTAGEHIGYFKGRIGLDIVLDYGDYQLENQENLFNLNVEYASKNEFVFDTSTIPGSTQTKVQRYKEYIHQFIDAAAFWGSHIDCGKIDIKNGTPLKTVSQINSIIQKYFTKDKIYIYIQENNKSFNYYDQINQTRKVYGFDSNGEAYKKDDWPILIKNISASVTNKIDFAFDYLIENVDIQQPERNISIDTIAPNLNLDGYPFTERANNTALSGKTNQVQITFAKVANNSPCANFAFFNVRVLQKFPVENYFNHLWIANLKSSLTIDLNEYDMYSCTYDKSRNISLDDTIGESAIIQNKVYFDKGKNTAGNVKRRRLYTAVIKNNSNKEVEYESLNIDTPHSIFVKKNANKQDYFLNLFKRDKDYSIYKGSFMDTSLGSGSTAVVNSLCIYHDNSLLKRNSYLLLGITEEEYNKLIFNNVTIVPTNTHLPNGADNLFIHLEEVFTITSENVRKFKVGIRYEDNTGSINSNILFPSTTNEVYVYTIDDLFFFSKEFSLYQNHFQEHPKAKVDFRVELPYTGEFGFDWMRIADSGALGDTQYKDHVGKLYSDVSHTNIEMDTNKYTGSFLKNGKMFKKLESTYQFFNMQVDSNNIIEKYYIPILTLYPPYNPTSSMPDLDRQNVFSPPYDDSLNRLAKLTLKIKITSQPIRIELDYDKTKFDISPINIPKTVGNHILNISVKCIKEFSNEQLILVRAIYNMGASKGSIVGMMRVKPNSKSMRFSKKILLVNVHTDIDGIGSPPSLIFNIEQQAKFLKKFVRQTLCTPIMEAVTIDLVANPDSIFASEFIGTSTTGNKYLKDQNTTGKFIIKYLYDYLTTTGPSPIGLTIYADYFKVFFFNDNGIPGRFGFSLPTLNLLADFTNNLPSTTTHEFLHTANVQHTFANYEGSSFAKFTYEPLSTDCIMDYSDFGASPPIPTISLYNWQSEIAKLKFDFEP